MRELAAKPPLLFAQLPGLQDPYVRRQRRPVAGIIARMRLERGVDANLHARTPIRRVAHRAIMAHIRLQLLKGLIGCEELFGVAPSRPLPVRRCKGSRPRSSRPDRP
jgi:hypothetical protein